MRAGSLRIATRGSALARWQADHVRARLIDLHPGLVVESVVVRTTGDRIADVPLAAIGDRGLFTKEVDRAVIDGDADLAVHSLKDLPTRIDKGLALAAVLEREDSRDAFVPAPGAPDRLLALPAGARVGTSSLRRRSQLLHLRPDLEVTDLRGNLDTRLRMLREGRYDAAILALAGLRRLGLASAAGEPLSPPEWLPAVGQGALAVIVRAGDAATLRRVAGLDHPPTRHATAAERAFLRELEGGCQIPIGALAADVPGVGLRLEGFVGSLDGRAMVRGSTGADEWPGAEGGEDDRLAAAEALGRKLASRLRAEGAGTILDAIRTGPLTRLPNVAAP